MPSKQVIKMNRNNTIIAIACLLLTACSATKTAKELPAIPSDASHQEVANHITITCAGFAKSGAENGHGTELTIFNDCMNEAIKIIETGSPEE